MDGAFRRHLIFTSVPLSKFKKFNKNDWKTIESEFGRILSL